MKTSATKTRPRIPVEKPYQGPYGTPMTHVQYREARHMKPERIPFNRHEKPVSLHLFDVSKESLENVQRLCASIKRLMVPSLNLKTVPESLVVHLQHLESLDLSHNKLTDSSFPDAMKTLDNLTELRLNDNHLTKVPMCVRKLKRLCRLDLSNNQVDSGVGLEKLKKLKVLVLDNNKLSSLFKDISELRRLEILRCSNNNIKEIPREVRNLRALTDLDVSNNRISLLPADVFQLPKLESLVACQNQIGKVPTFNVKVMNKHWISTIDLSDNNLVKFPGHLMLLSDKLDLTSNKIRTLSWSTLKKLDSERNHELVLLSNPLCYPPQDICESGLRSIKRFFQESQAEVKVYQGVKVLVVGSHRSGKSSLVHSLVDQQARLADDMTDMSAGMDAYEMSFDYDVEEGKPGKSLNLCIWDFCGHPFYLYPHYLFHEQPSITILTFSMADYGTDSFEQQIGSWFDWMIAKTNKLVVILVGTKCDIVPAKRAAEITREVREKLAAHLKKRQSLIESRIKEIEKRPVISPSLSEQLKACMKLFQARFTVQTEVIATSAKQFTGFQKLKDAIEALANDRKLFPNVMRTIPTFWVEVENWVEERGNALLVPVMHWEEFSEEVTQRFGMKHLLVLITQYLHESGKVLWFSSSPTLKSRVFLRPSWLFEVLKQIFRHDIENVTFIPDDTLKTITFTSAKFERLKQELLSEGVVDKELLKGLLVSILPADVSKPSSEVLQLLTEGLEVGYPVSKRVRDTSYNFRVEKDSEGKDKVTKLLIPWFRTCGEPASFREKWADLEERRRLAVQFHFPFYMPPGLFELMTVRAHHEKHKLLFLEHWGGGIHARHTEEKVHLSITYYANVSNTEHRKSVSPKAVVGELTQRSTQKVDFTSMTVDSTHFQLDKNANEKELFERPGGPQGHDSAVKLSSINERDEDDVNGNENDSDDNAREDRVPTVLQQSKRRSSEKLIGLQNKNLSPQTLGLTIERCEDRKMPDDEDAGGIILKFEIRDNSEDLADQTPAATMWNVLLPLLLDFEELLHGYNGVLVERHTECPICGEPSFLGDWLTPKETQSMNTRTCDSCNQQVDTAFLVQPREKKRDDVMRTLVRRSRRRGAAVKSEIDDIHKVAPPNPRRAALIPLEIGDASLRRLLGDRDSVTSDD